MTIRISSFASFDAAATFIYASRAVFPKVKSFSSATFIVIPPADAAKLMASFVVPCVFVTTIVSEVPILVVNEIALGVSCFETIVKEPPEILISLFAAASTSIPPVVAKIFTASPAVPCVLVMLILSVVAVSATNAISPSVFISKVDVLAVILRPPTVDLTCMESSEFPRVFVNVILSDVAELVVRTALPDVVILNVEFLAVIAIPPAVALISIAASSEPFVFTIRISSFPTVPDAATFTYASKAAFPNVKSFSSATFIVIPPAAAVNAIAELFVPCVFVTAIVSDEP